ncbi:MAG: retention module-containing protein [Campylobacter sp.]
MPTQIGTVKEAKGSVVAIDASGIRRVIRVGDAVYEGEVVKTNTMSSKVVITMNDLKEITIFGNDTVSMNQNQNLQNIAQNDQVADVSALQQALLNGGNLENLEETAAGGATAGGTAGIGGTSLGSVSFLSGGHETNVNASYNSLGALPPDAIATNNLGLGNSNNSASDDKTPPTVNIESVTPVDTNPKADGKADKAIVKGKSDEPNARVTVTNENGEVIGTGTTDDKGNFKISTDKPVNPGDKVKVEVEDKAGNKGEDTKTAGNLIHDDTTPPTVNIESVTPVDTNPKADGKADKAIVKGKSDEPNARVTVTNENGEVIGTGTTDDKGNFKISTDKPVNPGDKVKVEVEDKAGNKGEDKENAGDMDYTDKTKPTIDLKTVTPIDDSTEADGRADKVKVSGTTDQPKGSKVEISVGGKVIGEVEVGEGGKFEGTLDLKGNDVKPGTEVKATITDKAGNKGEDKENAGDMDYTDKTKPTIDLKTVTPIDDSTEADGRADKVKVSGTTDQPKGSKVEISVGGKVIGEVEVGEGGKFEGTLDLKGNDVKPGTEVKATITDKAGNKGEDKENAGDMYDVTPTITHYMDDVNLKGVPVSKLHQKSVTNDATPELHGTAKPNAEVSIYDNGKFIGTTMSDASGNFTFTSPALKDGAHNITARTEYSRMSGNFDFNVDTKASLDLTVSDATKGSDGNWTATVSGKANDVEVGRPVSITLPNGETVTTTVQSDGTFKTTVNYGPDISNSTMKVTASTTDNAGNLAKSEVGIKQITVEEKVTNTVKKIVEINESEMHLEGNVYRYKGANILDIYQTNGDNPRIHTRTQGDITDVLNKGGSLSGQRAVEDSSGKFHDSIDPNKATNSWWNKSSIKDRGPIAGLKEPNTIDFQNPIEELKKMYPDKTVNLGYTNHQGLVYHYKGQVTISGSNNTLFAKTGTGAAVIVKIDGKIVLAHKGDNATRYAYHKRLEKILSNLNGTHTIEIIGIKAGGRDLDSKIQVGVLSKNGKEVLLGQDSDGVKTDLLKENADLQGSTFNPETGQYEATTTVTKTVSHTTVEGGSSVAEHDTIGTDNADTIKGHDGKMIEGKDGNDTITGSDKGEHIDGGNGDDVINAGDGNDTIMGGAGNDTIDGGKGDDYIDGGDGSDSITAGEGNDKIVFDKEDSKIDGGDGKDTLVLKGGETIDFSGLGDKITSVEKLQLGESKDSDGTNVTLSAKDVLDITDGSQDSLVNNIPTLKINGDSKDKVSLKSSDNWTKVGGVDSDGYQTYESTSGGRTVHLQIDEKITTDFGQ